MDPGCPSGQGTTCAELRFFDAACLSMTHMRASFDAFGHRQRGRWRGALVRLGLLLAIIPMMMGLAYGTFRLLYHYPPKKIGTLPVGPKRPSLARKVVVVVIDGLSVDGARQMPQLMKLAKQGAWLLAQTGPLSYSRPGYASLGTGATMDLTGVTINKRSEIVPIDSIFHRARKAGVLAGIVGYAWWMELFGQDIPLASVDSAWQRNAPVMTKALASLPGPARLPKGFVRRILHKGRYVDAGEPWRRFLRRHQIADSFGDMGAASQLGDRLRVKEALRWLRREQGTGGWLVPPPAIRLLFVHLHGPDHAGHESGTPHSWAYQEACQIADDAVGQIAQALDLAKDALLVTSDHGFSRAFKHAGHGGWEASASHTPLVMVGKGIKKRWLPDDGKHTIHPAKRDALQLVRQVDVAPTVAILLGLPFPTITQGQPVWQVLDISRDTEGLRRHDLYCAQSLLGQALLGRSLSPLSSLCFGSPPVVQGAVDAGHKKTTHAMGAPVLEADGLALSALHARWQEVQQAVLLRRASRIRWGFVVRALLGLCVIAVLAWLWLLSGGGAWPKGIWWGVLAWLFYDIVFIAGYIGLFGNFSFSSFRLSPLGMVAFVGWHSYVFLVVLALGLGGMWLLGVGRRWRRLLAALQGFGLCALIKAAVGFGIIGWGQSEGVPHGLMLFGAVVGFFQAAAWAVAAILLGVWWPRRESQSAG